MPLLSCSCLNVQICHHGSLVPTYPGELPDSPTHEFFDDGVYVIKLSVLSVIKEIRELTSSTPISDTWDLHKCLCCNTLTHCVHTPTHTHVASTHLHSKQEVQALKQNPNYSTAFNIVLPPATAAPGSNEADIQQLPHSVQKMYQIYISTQEAECAERVRKFKLEQEKQMQKLLDKAKEERSQLLSLLKSHDKLDQFHDYSFISGGNISRHPANLPYLERATDRFGKKYEDVSALMLKSGRDILSRPEEPAPPPPPIRDLVDLEDNLLDQVVPYGELESDHLHLNLNSSSQLDLDTTDYNKSSDESTSDDSGDDSDEEDEDTVRNMGNLGGDGDSGFDVPAATGSFGSGDLVPVAQSVPVDIPSMAGIKPRRPRNHRRKKDKLPKTGRSVAVLAASMLAMSESVNPDPFGPFGDYPRPKRQSVPPHRL